MNLLLQWNHVLLDAIRALGKLPATSPDRARGGPPQVARSIGIVYTCAYDAWAAYDNVAKTAHSATPRRPVVQRTEPNRRRAVSQAIYRALLDQFPPAIFEPATRGKLEAAMAALLTAEGIAVGDTSVNANSPVGVGNLAANAVLSFRHADGANQAGLYADTGGYAAVNKPMPALLPAGPEAIADCGRWQPLSYLNSAFELKAPGFIAPHWGNVKPFAMPSGHHFRPGPPQPVLAQAFLEQARHVVEVQAALTVEQKVVAEYWADGPSSELPPGHWTEFAAFVAERDALDLTASVKLYFALANAILDASIATWECKRHYDYARPVTTIRHLYRGQRIRGWGGPGRGTQEILGESWRPFQVDSFPTPPFAEYTSGHSAFSMAAATVLKRYTGSDSFGLFYQQPEPLRADPSEPAVGVVLHWPTFTSAANEAGFSRLYGGIHFYEGNVVGLDMGRKCGDLAYTRAQNLWNGV